MVSLCLLVSQTSSSSIAECEPTSGLRVADSPGGGAVTGGAVVNVAPLAALQGVHLGAPSVGHPSQAGTGSHQQPAQQGAPRPHPAGLCLLCLHYKTSFP